MTRYKLQQLNYKTHFFIFTFVLAVSSEIFHIVLFEPWYLATLQGTVLWGLNSGLIHTKGILISDAAYFNFDQKLFQDSVQSWWRQFSGCGYMNNKQRLLEFNEAEINTEQNVQQLYTCVSTFSSSLFALGSGISWG